MSEAEKQTSTPPVAKVSIGSMLIAVIAAALVAVSITAAGAWYVLRSGKVGASAVASQALPSAASGKTKPLTLEPMLINLADAGGRAYLKMSVTLLIQDEVKKGSEDSEAKTKDVAPTASVRDAILAAATASTSDQLLSMQGKEELKKSIHAMLGKQVPELKVNEVLFTDFLVQR